MALNFPTDTSQPYYDPVSGLKYIYNSSIGAWETAIQPPAVIFDTAPVIEIPGFLWWDTAADERRLKIWLVEDGSEGEWVDATPTPAAAINLGDTPPDKITHPDLEQGDLWWDNVSGRLYIYYVDPADAAADRDGQWVDASPVPDNGARGNAYIAQGENPPSDPEPNDMWFDTVSGNMFIWYEDEDSSQWVITQNISGQAANIETIIASGPLSVAGTKTEPILSIANASTSAAGITKIATLAEAVAGTSMDTVLTPGILKSTISNYLDGQTIQYATEEETAKGLVGTKAVSPATLSSVLSGGSFGGGNPCGTIITFASQTAPAGYLKCDGSDVHRVQYSELFAVIGTTFGIGNGATTFTLPTLTSDNPSIVNYIKS